MRKLFWTCTICSVVLAGGVISTAHYAAHHPESVIGRVLNGASYAAAYINPVSGLAPSVADARSSDPAFADESGEPVAIDSVPADPVPVPDDPAPAPDDKLRSGLDGSDPTVIANTGSAPIVIPEEDRLVLPAGESSAEPPLCPVEHTEAVSSAIECPAIVPGAAPTLMPHCEDGEECESLPMPTEEPELLPMPHLDEDDADGMSLEFVPVKEAEMLKTGDNTATPEQAMPKCDEHCPAAGCPHTGKTSPRTHGSEEPNELSHKSALHKLKIFHDGEDEDYLEHFDVDTMEFRASDRHLYDYGPGAL
jgi:hypothetical protein